MPALLVRWMDGASRVVDLSVHPISLGRSDACDVHLPSDEVSREHAQVWLDHDGRVLVADRRSKNGTRVDGGEPFRDAVRTATRSIRIGEYEIQVIGAPDAGEAEPPIRFQHDAPTGVGDASFFPSSRGLDLNHQRLTLFMSLAERIGGVFDRKQLLEQALDACCETLGFERGMVVLRTQRGDTELPVVRNIERDPTGAYMVSRTLINRALVHGERAVVNNPALDLVGNLSESLVRFPICSALCVPIVHRDEILGVIYGDRITRASTYTPQDVDFLAALARQVGVGLANLRLLARHVELQRMTEEIRQAREIQQRLLPAQPLAAGRVELAGYNAPSSAVGGDYFDYFLLPDGRIGLIIADVTGHGLPASLMMANLQAAVRVALTVELPLSELVGRLNRLICHNTESNVFITAIVGRLDPVSGEVEYANAGHPGPLVLAGQRIEPAADGHALPLGIEPDEVFPVQRIRPDGQLDAVLFFTDGVIEAASPSGELLGIDPVRAALGATDRSPDALIQATLSVVDDFLGAARNADDLTLMALHYRSAPGA